MALFNGEKRVRNADKARNSFVTRRAESKLDALADFFKLAAGKNWICTNARLLRREIVYSEFLYLDSLKLIYNWENRFMSVNYNLQMIADLRINEKNFIPLEKCVFKLHCDKKLIGGKRIYSWSAPVFSAGPEYSEEMKKSYIERLQNPLIIKRLEQLDILEMEMSYNGGQYFKLSCESIIGSASWILIPPVFSMVTPKLEECVKFYELFELLGDAAVNNSFR